MIQFAWPWVFVLAPLPMIVRWLMPPAPAATPSALKLPFFHELQSPGRGPRTTSRSRVYRVAAWLVWLLLLLAAARPQWLGEPVTLPLSGRDLMLAVDVSGSMQQEDYRLGGRPVNRLDVVKAVAGRFIERRDADRLGLILFGSRAYLQTPLTYDRQTVRTMLQETVIGLAGRETAIGDAIGLAVKRLRDQPEQNRVLLLLTDGANTAGAVDPLKAADLAAQEGVRIYTIGVGGDRMRISTPFGTRTLPATDLDERVLRQIAEKTAGGYFRARDTAALARIYAELDAIEPASEDALSYRPVHELYAWPLGIALALSVLTALPMRPTGQKPSRTRERSHV